jgi:hypothetical protein
MLYSYSSGTYKNLDIFALFVQQSLEALWYDVFHVDLRGNQSLGITNVPFVRHITLAEVKPGDKDFHTRLNCTYHLLEVARYVGDSTHVCYLLEHDVVRVDFRFCFP